MLVKKLLSPSELKTKIKLSHELKKIIYNNTRELKKIINGESNKFLIILGPCSVHDACAIYQYAKNLSQIYKFIKQKIFIILRLFTIKPRSDLINNFKGILHQPDINKPENIYNGIIFQRELIIKTISLSGLAIANELIYPEIFDYTSDLISYYVLGARTVDSQLHKLFCSNINFPLGIKNPLDGDLNILYKTLCATQSSNNFIYNLHEFKSFGNKYSHIILRGSKTRENYHYEDLIRAINLYPDLKNKFILVDTNHGNSNKNYHEQPRIIREILFNIKQNNLIKKFIRGIMLESFLKSGSQKTNKTFGKSITDPCLNLSNTQKILKYLYDNL